MTSALDHRGRAARRGHRPRREDARPATTSTSFWATLSAGRVERAAPIERIDPRRLPVDVRRARCATSIRPRTSGPKEARRLDRVTQLGFAAAADALGDAGDAGRRSRVACAVIVGTGVGGLHTLEEQIAVYLEKGPRA